MGIYYVIGLERKNKKVSGERKMFLLFFILWIAFNAKISLEIILFGIAICGVIFTFLCKCMDYSVRKEITLYKMLPLLIHYFIVLLWEILKANILMLKMIILDKYINEPVIVTFKCDLSDESCKVLLANSITLTPGTITVDIDDNLFTVHCFDKDMAEGIDDIVFIKLLKKIEKVKNGGKRVVK